MLFSAVTPAAYETLLTLCSSGAPTSIISGSEPLADSELPQTVTSPRHPLEKEHPHLQTSFLSSTDNRDSFSSTSEPSRSQPPLCLPLARCSYWSSEASLSLLKSLEPLWDSEGSTTFSSLFLLYQHLFSVHSARLSCCLRNEKPSISDCTFSDRFFLRYPATFFADVTRHPCGNCLPSLTSPRWRDSQWHLLLVLEVAPLLLALATLEAAMVVLVALLRAALVVVAVSQNEAARPRLEWIAMVTLSWTLALVQNLALVFPSPTIIHLDVVVRDPTGPREPQAPNQTRVCSRILFDISAAIRHRSLEHPAPDSHRTTPYSRSWG